MVVMKKAKCVRPNSALGGEGEETNQGNNTVKYTHVKKRKDLGVSKVSKTEYRRQ